MEEQELYEYFYNITGDLSIESNFNNDSEFINDYANNLTLLITLLSIGITLIFVGLFMMAFVLCYLLLFGQKINSSQKYNIFYGHKKADFRELCLPRLFFYKCFKTIVKFLLSVIILVKMLIMNLIVKKFYHIKNHF